MVAYSRVAEKCKQRSSENGAADHSAPSISVFYGSIAEAAKCPNYISITAINYNYSI